MQVRHIQGLLLGGHVSEGLRGLLRTLAALYLSLSLSLSVSRSLSLSLSFFFSLSGRQIVYPPPVLGGASLFAIQRQR